MNRSVVSPPVVLVAFLAYAVLLGFLMAVLYFGALQLAFESLGLSRRAVFWVLVVSLFGSSINIPVTTLKSRHKSTPREVLSVLRKRFPIPDLEPRSRTVIAVNLGGAVVPLVISAYLLISHPAVLPAAGLATALVSMVVYWAAVPVEGVGVTVPLFLPPLLAAVVALLLSAQLAPMIAYVSGTLGTLIGADLFNLDKIAESGAPLASIGGAGTFHGVFLSGILAVLLAGVPGG